jgi:hypothetical protein
MMAAKHEHEGRHWRTRCSALGFSVDFAGLRAVGLCRVFALEQFPIILRRTRLRRSSWCTRLAPARLWLPRLAMRTTSPGRSSGTST